MSVFVCLQLSFMGVSRFRACSLGVRIGRFWILGFRIEGLGFRVEVQD